MTEDYRDRFSELEVDLWNAVTWTALLDKIVEDLDRLPSMSKREVNISLGQLSHVTDALKGLSTDSMPTITAAQKRRRSLRHRTVDPGSERGDFGAALFHAAQPPSCKQKGNLISEQRKYTGTSTSTALLNNVPNLKPVILPIGGCGTRG